MRAESVLACAKSAPGTPSRSVTILQNPRYTGRQAGRQAWNRQRADMNLADPADVSFGTRAGSG